MQPTCTPGPHACTEHIVPVQLYLMHSRHTMHICACPGATIPALMLPHLHSCTQRHKHSASLICISRHAHSGQPNSVAEEQIHTGTSCKHPALQVRAACRVFGHEHSNKPALKSSLCSSHWPGYPQTTSREQRRRQRSTVLPCYNVGHIPTVKPPH